MIDQPDAGAATRMRIVLAAMELFWEKGYQSTSVADLLQRAGVHSGSLYHFFPGKQDVLLAVLDLYHNGIDEMLLAPVWKDVADPIERVFALLAKYRELIIQTDCTYGCPIGSLALELHEPDPPVRSRLAANFTAWVDAIDGCLRRSRSAASQGRRPARPRQVRADDDGRRRDARPHLSRRRACSTRRSASSAIISIACCWTAQAPDQPPASPGRSIATMRTMLLRMLVLLLSARLVRWLRRRAGRHFQPQAFLAGVAGRARFPTASAPTSTASNGCTAGQFLRDRHTVTGGAAPYAGETIYYLDATIEDRPLPLHQRARRQQPGHGHAERRRAGVSPRKNTATASWSRPIAALAARRRRRLSRS